MLTNHLILQSLPFVDQSLDLGQCPLFLVKLPIAEPDQLIVLTDCFRLRRSVIARKVE